MNHDITPSILHDLIRCICYSCLSQSAVGFQRLNPRSADRVQDRLTSRRIRRIHALMSCPNCAITSRTRTVATSWNCRRTICPARKLSLTFSSARARGRFQVMLQRYRTRICHQKPWAYNVTRQTVVPINFNSNHSHRRWC